MKKQIVLFFIMLFATMTFAQIGNTPQINTPQIQTPKIKKADVVKMRKDLKIGDTFQGGIIIHLWDNGQHGIICAKENIGYLPWGKYGVTNAPHMGGDADHTQAIVNQLGAGNYAAKACMDYRGGGYDDWFLPSKIQLGYMISRLHKKRKGNFAAGVYWSGNECEHESSSYEKAWGVHFGSYDDDYRPTARDKKLKGYVRPVRAF